MSVQIQLAIYLSFVDFVWERYFYIQSKSEKTIQNKLDLLLQELRKSNMK